MSKEYRPKPHTQEYEISKRQDGRFVLWHKRNVTKDIAKCGKRDGVEVEQKQYEFDQFEWAPLGVYFTKKAARSKLEKYTKK